MRLTNTHREAFVRSVMQDVPKLTDRSDLLALSTQNFINTVYLPKEVQRMIKNPVLADYIKSFRLNVAFFKEDKTRLLSLLVPWTSPIEMYSPTDTVNLRWEALKDNPKFIKLYKEAEEYVKAITTYKELEEKLKQVAKSCNTLKQLQEALPAYIKYMPSEPNQPVSKGYALVVTQASITEAFKQLGGPLSKAANDATVKKAA